MKNKLAISIGLSLFFVLGLYVNSIYAKPVINQVVIKKTSEKENIKLGAFSMSLNVKDLKVSKAFYENLGFHVMGGGEEINYLIMKNGNALIGIFQGMFEGNILTFNPGWDENGENVEKFNDIREIQKHLKTSEIKLMSEVKEATKGPASIMLTDPDGNMILIDQHR